jgi:hypothetical protein
VYYTSSKDNVNTFAIFFGWPSNSIIRKNLEHFGQGTMLGF